MRGNNALGKIIEIRCKKLGPEKCVGPSFYEGFCMPAPGCSLPARPGPARPGPARPGLARPNIT